MLHHNMMDFRSYKDSATQKLGLVRTATLIKDAHEAENSVLVDDGDVLLRAARWALYGGERVERGRCSSGLPAMKTILDYVGG
ncbi:hypothetical protein ACLK2E_22850 [Escherichia coli]